MSKFKKPLRNRSETKIPPISGKAGLELPPLAQLLSFNFKQIDTNQGQSFDDWNSADLLKKMLDTLKSCSSMTLQEAGRANIRLYDTFPTHSEFTHPAHVSKDVSWASMHIQGKECLAGHIFGNVFYIVFLDRDHKFYPVSKKHT